MGEIMKKLDVICDMETGDPDDYFMLLLLIGHPAVNLKAVTVTPGAPDQIGLVKKVLDKFDLRIPIGAFNIEHPKQCVSKWYYNVLGKIEPYTKISSGADVICENCDENTTVIPHGSVIYHWANGITELYGPDNERLFIARDSEASQPVAPGGPKPATHILQVPSGAHVSDEGDNITKVYLGDATILTIINKSEDYQP